MASRVVHSRLSRIGQDSSPVVEEGNQVAHHKAGRKNTLGTDNAHAAGGD